MPIPTGHKEKGKTRPGPFSKTTVFKGDDVPTGLSGLGAGKPCSYRSAVFSWIWCLLLSFLAFPLKGLGFRKSKPITGFFSVCLRT